MMLGLYSDAEHYALNTNADPWLIASWVLQDHSHSSFKGRQFFRKTVVRVVNEARRKMC